MARRRGSNMRAVPSAAMLLALVAAGCGGAAPEEGNSLPDESRQCDANQERLSTEVLCLQLAEDAPSPLATCAFTATVAIPDDAVIAGRDYAEGALASVEAFVLAVTESLGLHRSAITATSFTDTLNDGTVSFDVVMRSSGRAIDAAVIALATRRTPLPGLQASNFAISAPSLSNSTLKLDDSDAQALFSPTGLAISLAMSTSSLISLDDGITSIYSSNSGVVIGAEALPGEPWVFLHIPKTGGSSVERMQAAAGQVPIKSGLTRWMMAAHKMGQAAFPTSCIPMRSFGVTPWHYTPEQMARCAFALNPYQNSRVWCIVRHPVQRFVSEFRWRQAMIDTQGEQGLWTHNLPATFGRNASGDFDIWAAARDAASALAAASQAKMGTSAHHPVDDHLLHLIPQAWYVRDSDGKRTCHKVLTFEDATAHFTTHENKGSNSLGAFLAPDTPEAGALASLLEAPYAVDLELYEQARATAAGESSACRHIYGPEGRCPVVHGQRMPWEWAKLAAGSQPLA